MIRWLVLLLGLVLIAPAPSDASTAALRERLKVAKSGDAEAQYRLGLDYRTGNGLPKNLAQAYKWIRLAALANLPEAQRTIGQMDRLGEGTARKPADAADWFRRAAKQNDMTAILALADMLRRGDGIPIDLPQAATYYRMAAERNDFASQLILADLLSHDTRTPGNRNEAVTWLRRAATSGRPEAYYRLGLALLEDDPASGRPHRPSRQTEEGIVELRRAAGSGHAAAQFSLAMAHYDGIAAPLDRDRAWHWLLLSADQDYLPALEQLALCYRWGSLTARDPARAYMVLEIAGALPESPANLRALHDQVGRDLTPLQISNAKKRAQEWLAGREPPS